MIRERAIQITGRGANITFVVGEHAPFEQVIEELETALAQQAGLFSEGAIAVHTGRRELAAEERERLRQLIERRSGLTVSRIQRSPEAGPPPIQQALERLEGRRSWLDAAPIPSFIKQWSFRANGGGADGAGLIESGLEEALPSPRRSPRPPASRQRKPPVSFEPEESVPGEAVSRTTAMLIKATFHSGEFLKHPGDVVVLGDVNPGSEIQADGDIIVMGALQGQAHAGAGGNNQAAVIAREIAAPRLRIGRCEALAPPENRRRRNSAARPAAPLIAYVRRRSIYVAPWAGRFASYTEGVLYEG